MRIRGSHILAVVLLAASTLASGCTSYHPTAAVAAMRGVGFVGSVGLTPPAPVTAVQAVCAPPLGWRQDALKSSDRHTHQVWVSPTGNTAYGVIHMNLPFPVGVDLVHWQFMREMKKKEGEAIDLGEDYDNRLPGLRFVAEGGKYKLRGNLMVRGTDAWVSYAGTLRNMPVDPTELSLAERARENTTPGVNGGNAAKID